MFQTISTHWVSDFDRASVICTMARPILICSTRFPLDFLVYRNSVELHRNTASGNSVKTCHESFSCRFRNNRFQCVRIRSAKLRLLTNETDNKRTLIIFNRLLFLTMGICSLLKCLVNNTELVNNKSNLHLMITRELKIEGWSLATNSIHRVWSGNLQIII